MYHIPLKSLVHRMHMPSRHETGVKMQKLVHDERFWAIVAIVVIMALLITLAIVAGTGTGASPNFTPMYPYYP